jgi:uncharacterized protein (TIGR03437 family)
MKKPAILFLFALVPCFAQSASNAIMAPGYTVAAVPLNAVSAVELQPSTINAIAVDSSGNLYLASGGPVYRIAPGGAVSLFAGGGGSNTPFLGDGGPATQASVNPSGLAVDGAGNLYIADEANGRIRKVDTNGIISTIAGPGGAVLGDGGPATSASVSMPTGVAVDSFGNIFVAQLYNYRVRKISPAGIITTVAGNGLAAPTGQPSNCACGDGGPATSATVPYPAAVATDSTGNLYIADLAGTRIRKVSATGIITTIAGNGTAVIEPGPFGIVVSLPSYGDGGPAVSAQIAGVGGGAGEGPALGSFLTGMGNCIGVDSAGDVFLVDETQIRIVTPDGRINAVAGGGPAPIPTSSGVGSVPATSVSIQGSGGQGPYSLAVGSGDKIYFAIRSPTELSQLVLALTPSTPTFPVPALVEWNSASGFADGSSLPKSVALGGWMEIYGSYLAPDTRQWATGDFTGVDAPTSLDGTSVTVGGQPAFVSYISPSQVNVQVPSNIGTGPQPLVMTNANGRSSTSAVTVNPEQPALLSTPAFDIKGSQYAVALFPDGVTYVLPTGAIPGVLSRPANKGDTITLYGIGFGPTTPSIPSGQIVQTTSSLALPLTVTIGASNANVTYAGLAPGVVGLYQFNVVVPVSYGQPTAAPLTLSLGAGASATLALSVQ